MIIKDGSSLWLTKRSSLEPPTWGAGNENKMLSGFSISDGKKRPQSSLGSPSCEHIQLSFKTSQKKRKYNVVINLLQCSAMERL
jgi:hypothetical protein